MEHTRFVGLDIHKDLDIHKERISIAVAESGRSGVVEYLGEIANEPGAISKLCDRLRRPGKPLAFCYEALESEIAGVDDYYDPVLERWKAASLG